MAKPKHYQQEQSYYEQDWSDENQDCCPGYRYLDYEIAGEPYTTMIKCEWDHPHQEAIKMPGNVRVPIYPYLKDLATERQANWAIKSRQKRCEKRQVGRLEGAKGLRMILGKVKHEQEELLHGGPDGVGQDKATPDKSTPDQPGGDHRAALVPLVEISPDLDDWLASVKGKATADDDDWNKEKDIPEV